MTPRHQHVLDGCRPVPLAHYLKALAVLRLVGEQKDPGARGAWRQDRFLFETKLDETGLTEFFLREYRPTPIVAPWNGGSGFFPKDHRQALEALAGSPAARFAEYRQTIAVCAELLTRLGVTEKIDKATKPGLLEAVRGRLPEAALAWFDAACLLGCDEPKYPPLLGTGGNDGRLDFSNNFMQRLLDLVDPDSGEPLPRARGWLEDALWGDATSSFVKAAVGQFLPAGAGGANATAGFDGRSLVNPWDFVLMLEGSLLFAAAAVRRFEHDPRGALSFPFTVRSVGAGYGSAAAADESMSRDEMWLPLWERPATAAEVRALLSEGRARVGSRPAAHGLDFARAVAALGVDRGITEFQRYGFLKRNGDAHFAAVLGRHPVRLRPAVGRLLEIDGWLETFRRRASSEHAPTSVARALRSLESAVFDFCRGGAGQGHDVGRFQAVLVALGACERALARSLRWTVGKPQLLAPVRPALSPGWLEDADDGSVEFRLAASLASVSGIYPGPDGRPCHLPLRCHLEPVSTSVVDRGLRVRWDAEASREVVAGSSLPTLLNAIFARRLVRVEAGGIGSYSDRGRLVADLGDLADFVDGRIDDDRVVNFLWGLALLDWPRVKGRPLAPRPEPGRPAPGALFALLKLCFAGGTELPDRAPVPAVPRIHRHAAAGDGTEAFRLAQQRLRGSGRRLRLPALHQQGNAVIRAAAALLFPLSPADLQRLERLLRVEEVDAIPTAGARPKEGVTS